MIRRLYAHNYRCLENFELKLAGLRSALLVGGNGSGKSTIGRVLEVLQSVARGKNRVRDLVDPLDFTAGKVAPMRFELDVELGGRTYRYVLALELPRGFKELRVLEERLGVDEDVLYQRDVAQVSLSRSGQGARFAVDWHLVALPLIQPDADDAPLAVFRNWLRGLLVLAPVPALMSGSTEGPTSELSRSCANFGAVLAELFAQHPPAWTPFDEQLKAMLPDVFGIATKPELRVSFQRAAGEPTVEVPFRLLSDGERCFFLGAFVNTLRRYSESLFCFWDEPDAFLSLSEVGHFVNDLRYGFERAESGQLLVTSHREEAIRRFGEASTLVVHRANHLEPTQITPLSELKVTGGVISALVRGDLTG
ncbi:MAG: AAA family ATPase [Planctomycetota bacterium]